MGQAEGTVIHIIYFIPGTHLVLFIRLNLHQPLSTGKHCKILRQIACDIGKRILYLTDKLQHRHKGSVCHSAIVDTECPIDSSEHIGSVHNCPKTDIAHIGEMILSHTGFLVLAHMAFSLSKTILFFAKGFYNHQASKMLLQKDTDKSILFLHLLVPLLKLLSENVAKQHQKHSSRHKDIGKSWLHNKDYHKCSCHLRYHSGYARNNRGKSL